MIIRDPDDVEIGRFLTHQDTISEELISRYSAAVRRVESRRQSEDRVFRAILACILFTAVGLMLGDSLRPDAVVVLVLTIWLFATVMRVSEENAFRQSVE